MKLTQAVAKNPITQHFLRQAQRHHKYPEQEVCQGQGCHKPVLDILQREVGEDGDDDEEVADDDHGHDENADNADEDDLIDLLEAFKSLEEYKYVQIRSELNCQTLVYHNPSDILLKAMVTAEKPIRTHSFQKRIRRLRYR